MYSPPYYKNILEEVFFHVYLCHVTLNVRWSIMIGCHNVSLTVEGASIDVLM